MTTLDIRIQHDRIDATLRRGRRTLWVGEARCDAPDDVTEAIVQLATAEVLPARPRRLRVVLEAPLVQVRELRDLPPVRRPALRALVALQSSRFFRRNGKPLITDAVWIRQARGKERMAKAAAVEEPWLDAVAVGAQAAGLHLETIAPAGDRDTAALRFLPLQERVRRHRAEWLAVRRLAMLAILVWVTAVGLIVSRVMRETKRVDHELAMLEAPVKAVMAVRQRMTEVSRTVEAITNEDDERRRVLRRIAAIVAVLPDSSYLTSLTVGVDGTGSLTGAARQAAQVAAALDRAEVVEGASLVGPAVREVAAGREWERFTIRFGRGDEP